MSSPFSPSFAKFQADIEAYLAAQGKREKTNDGFIVYHDYDDGLKLMFNRYIEHGAFEPLVSHFRAWNWEHSYNEYLIRLTDALIKRRDWPLLKHLWSAVIANRRRLYNEIRKLEKKAPGTVPATSLKASTENLIETLERVRSYSAELGPSKETKWCEEMITKVKAGRKA